MAPPPEYDKEPKAPDKTATSNSTDDAKLLNNLANDLHTNSDLKSSNSTATAEVENNKHIETLDDGQLRALLDEAITYKCPKDREGKSSLFKELLEEVEQDEQACEEAARTLGGCRGAAGAGVGAGARRGGRGRRALPHSNSLQDLVAALAAESVPRRHHVRHHQPAPAPSNVSARATHGGSLPSGVDTSSLGEEPRAGYLATVHCVNPPPLAERRVSASDANAPNEMELLNRRSKPMFPMTYTARATLEIGSGSVCSGRAVTTTTASNQVRTSPTLPRYGGARPAPRPPPAHRPPRVPAREIRDSQAKLMRALRPRTCTESVDEGGGRVERKRDDVRGKDEVPRGPTEDRRRSKKEEIQRESTRKLKRNENLEKSDQLWVDNVNNWYKTLSTYERTNDLYDQNCKNIPKLFNKTSDAEVIEDHRDNNASHDISYVSKLRTEIGLETISTNNKIEDKKIIKGESRNNDYSENLYRVNKESSCDNEECDINLRKKYRKRVGLNLISPTPTLINPKNVRSMTIGQPSENILFNKCLESAKSKHMNIDCENKNIIDMDAVSVENAGNPVGGIEQTEVTDSACRGVSKVSTIPNRTNSSDIYLNTANVIEMLSINKDIELNDVVRDHLTRDTNDKFSQYVAEQQQFFEALEATNLINDNEVQTSEYQDKMLSCDTESTKIKTVCDTTQSNDQTDLITEMIINDCCDGNNNNENCDQSNNLKCDNSDSTAGASNEIASQLKENACGKPSGDRYVLAELPNNAYVFLTLPKRLLAPLSGCDDKTVQLREIDYNSDKAYDSKSSSVTQTDKKKMEKTPVGPSGSSNKKKDSLSKNALKVLLLENLFKSNVEKSLSGKPGVSSVTDAEVDSAISFSCITTPEVVASCNTTSSSSQAAVAVDPKPLQLGSSYRAVASVTGAAEPPPRAPPGAPPALAPPGDSPAHAPSGDPPAHAPAPAPSSAPPDAEPVMVAARAQPRSVISSTFNGLPLSRPNYGATATTGSDDYKKSLDENGNSVQGFSSPLSGSSQHKKPRRKKSSKNETVIDCQQIDGYQGDKDVNELLRFIESDADHGRGAKLGRVKHKDDADDKAGKKRSTERRKDKESKMKRATSLEELSRTKLEDLTAAADRQRAPAKPERRSWGEARPEPDAPSAAELTDFQTVTKKRRARRRADEPAPRRARPPEPRARRDSAPPSDRSADSNDDTDSHSPPRGAPPPPPAAPPPASYADIARTRHNIPDLIESCNFYADGQPARPPPEDYPALERAKRPRAPRKAPPVPAAAPPAAPDVVADRRPPVVLLDEAARPRDMDGVTFGFDINEQLLGGTPRRARLDLLRDAEPPALAPPALAALAAPAPPGVPVRAGCAALRYVPPDPPADTHHLHQIVDYVGSAWEDVVRCGGGKVRYFSE